MNNELIFGLISTLVSSLMLCGAYSKKENPHEIIKLIKILFSPGWVIYAVAWLAFASGAFQVFRGLNFA